MNPRVVSSFLQEQYTAGQVRGAENEITILVENAYNRTRIARSSNDAEETKLGNILH